MSASEVPNRLGLLDSLLNKLIELLDQLAQSVTSDVHRAVSLVIASIFLYKAELCTFHSHHFPLATLPQFNILNEFIYLQNRGGQDIVILGEPNLVANVTHE